MNTAPRVVPFFDPATWTFTYVVEDPGSAATFVVDPVLDYDPRSGAVSTDSAAKVLAHLRNGGRRLDWILETHAHADHLSAAQWLKRELGGGPQVGIGSGIRRVQAVFRDILGLGESFPVDGRQFDGLFADGDTFAVGGLDVQVMGTPGHTPDSVTFRVGDAAFVGDTVFSPGYGTARCDFPGGDAAQLYDSIQKLYALPDSTRLYLCHDYPPQGQSPEHLSSPCAQRSGNVHLHAGVTLEQFVELRQRRDASLAKPVLLWPSVQVNIRAGALPEPDAAGRRFLKVPLSGATP
jgi:glyoxylase-like metal-dependent hydrolase (beta-lactamase superfamily II)